MKYLIKSIYYLILACRPLTLVVSTLPVCLTISLIFRDQLLITNVDQLISRLIIGINILIVAGLIQIISNLANDYFDFRKGVDQQFTARRKVLPEQLVHPRFFLVFLLNICFLTVILAVPLVVLGGLPIFAIGVSAISFAFLYSATRFSLANNYLSELFIFLYFGPIATAGGYFLLTTEWSVIALGLGVAPGLLGIALLEVNNLRDYQTDLVAGRKNLVTKFGPRLNFHLLKLLYLFPPFSLLFFGQNSQIFILIGIALSYSCFLCYLTSKESPSYKQLFLNTIGLIFILQVLALITIYLNLYSPTLTVF